jgi:hypothetical protein
MSTSGHDPYAFGQIQFGQSPKAASVDSVAPEAARAGSDRSRDTSWDPPAREDLSESAPVAESAGALATAAANGPRVDAPKNAAQPERIDRTRGVLTACKPVVAAPVVAVKGDGATLVEALVPAVVFSATEAIAAWLWLSADNPVLASLAALLGLGLAAFAWFAMRR